MSRIPLATTSVPIRVALRLVGIGRRGSVLAVVVAALACTGTGGDDAVPGEPDTLAQAPAPAAVRADLDEEFELPHGETAVIGAELVTVRFRRLVEESRCPSDVQCPTAGNAAAELALETADGAAATLTLNTRQPPAEAPAHGYRVRLIGLWPEPASAGAAVDTADYVATLTVTQAEDPSSP